MTTRALLRRGRDATCTTPAGSPLPAGPGSFYEAVAERPVRRGLGRVVARRGPASTNRSQNDLYDHVAAESRSGFWLLLRRGRRTTCTTSRMQPTAPWSRTGLLRRGRRTTCTTAVHRLGEVPAGLSLLRRGRRTTCTTTPGPGHRGQGLRASTKRPQNDLYDVAEAAVASVARIRLLRRGRRTTCTTPHPVGASAAGLLRASTKRPQNDLYDRPGDAILAHLAAASTKRPQNDLYDVVDLAQQRAGQALASTKRPQNDLYDDVVVLIGPVVLLPASTKRPQNDLYDPARGRRRSRAWRSFYEEAAERPVRRRAARLRRCSERASTKRPQNDLYDGAGAPRTPSRRSCFYEEAAERPVRLHRLIQHQQVARASTKRPQNDLYDFDGAWSGGSGSARLLRRGRRTTCTTTIPVS